jgi:photosystem II stability/assembly factor-like uncharacterized protein
VCSSLGAASALLVALAALATAADSRANGRFPAAEMLVARAGDSSSLALRTTFGLLLSRDAGSTWDWVCERAIGFSGAEDPSVVVASNGNLVVGLSAGVSTSADGACLWRRDARSPRGVVDMALRTGSVETIYAIASEFASMVEAGAPMYRSALFVSVDGGEHWSERSEFDPTLALQSVEVAPSTPGRVYVSAARSPGRATAAYLLASDDDGRSWHEQPLALLPSERGAYIGAVSPVDARRLYVRTSGPDVNRLLVSDDGARTFREVLRGESLRGFALMDEGKTVFAGDKAGLHRASATDLRFEQRWPQPVQCLAGIGGALWACASMASGFVLGVSDDAGASFVPRLTFAGIRGPLACSGASSMGACTEEWGTLGFGGERARTPEPVSAAGADATTAPTSKGRASSCACSAPGASLEPRTGPWVGAAVAWLVGFARRRRGGSRARATEGGPLRPRGVHG